MRGWLRLGRQEAVPSETLAVTDNSSKALSLSHTQDRPSGPCAASTPRTPSQPRHSAHASPAPTRAVVVRAARADCRPPLPFFAVRGRGGGHLKLVEVDAAGKQLGVGAALRQAALPQYQDVVGSWQVLQLVRDQDAGGLRGGREHG